MLLPIGATIRCRDGEAGRLKYVVVDPDDRTVTNLIVERGVLLRHDVVVPAAWVEQSSQYEIVLNATAAELEKLPKYREIDFTEPDPLFRPISGHQVQETRLWIDPYVAIGGGKPRIARHVRLGVNDDEVLLRRGMRVETREGQAAGELDHLVVTPARLQVTHLVIRRGWLWNRQMRMIPLERVAEMSDDAVRLNMSADELEMAPAYQPPASDAEIATSLQRSLETDPRTRASGLRVNVEDGVVRFSGNDTQPVLDAAQTLAQHTHGVIDVAEQAQATAA